MKHFFAIFVLLIVAFSVATAQSTRKFALETNPSFSPSVKTVSVPEIVVQEGHSGFIVSAEYSNDGKYLFTSSENTVKIWQADTGNLIKTFNDIDFFL